MGRVRLVRRHFFQHAGLRPIESDAPVEIREDVYETDALVSQYCEFHYGGEYFGVANFPRQLAEICRELTGGKPVARALDLGCATGRATFELARFCDFVTGIDFSARFIRVGHELQEKGYARYQIQDEGELELVHEALALHWRRLARWIDESREDLSFLSEVDLAARLWERRGRPT